MQYANIDLPSPLMTTLHAFGNMFIVTCLWFICVVVHLDPDLIDMAGTRLPLEHLPAPLLKCIPQHTLADQNECVPSVWRGVLCDKVECSGSN